MRLRHMLRLPALLPLTAAGQGGSAARSNTPTAGTAASTAEPARHLLYDENYTLKSVPKSRWESCLKDGKDEPSVRRIAGTDFPGGA